MKTSVQVAALFKQKTRYHHLWLGPARVLPLFQQLIVELQVG